LIVMIIMASPRSREAKNLRLQNESDAAAILCKKLGFTVWKQKQSKCYGRANLLSFILEVHGSNLTTLLSLFRYLIVHPGIHNSPKIWAIVGGLEIAEWSTALRSLSFISSLPREEGSNPIASLLFW
jgi:hypothetical protein